MNIESENVLQLSLEDYVNEVVHGIAPIFKLNQKDIIEWYVDNFMEK